MSEETNNQTEKEMTPQELAEFRKKATSYYKDQVTVLKAQLEYESLLADIEEARLKRMTMTIRMAQMMAGPPKEERTPPPPLEDNREEAPVRKLKTQD